ncbi:MAG: transcriptional regulator NrdR [Planctomycetes bacterium]|nr:transcriptional regulator NrdR [Planctomycetota bacterium]
MRCPYCQVEETKVVDSRASGEGYNIRRRRECASCGGRFTTYERIEEHPKKVVKKDGRREAYNKKKVVSGIEKACEKRPVSTESIDLIVDELEEQLRLKFDREIPGEFIGTFLMDKLRDLDQVAYVRFASVYRNFEDVDDFLRELKPMIKGKK